jgi:hypothetical protein
MLVLKRPCFWQQLDGPIAGTIFDGIKGWFKRGFESTMDYFSKFSIETATGDHLTTIGLLMGIPRPLVYDLEVEDLWLRFRQYYEPNSDLGLAGDHQTIRLPGVDAVTDLPDPSTLDPAEVYICEVTDDPNPDNNRLWTLPRQATEWRVYEISDPGLLDRISRGPDKVPYVYVGDELFRKILLSLVTSEGRNQSLKMFLALCETILGDQYELVRKENIYPGDWELRIKNYNYELYVLFLALVPMWLPTRISVKLLEVPT